MITYTILRSTCSKRTLIVRWHFICCWFCWRHDRRYHGGWGHHGRRWIKAPRRSIWHSRWWVWDLVGEALIRHRGGICKRHRCSIFRKLTKHGRSRRSRGRVSISCSSRAIWHPLIERILRRIPLIHGIQALSKSFISIVVTIFSLVPAENEIQLYIYTHSNANQLVPVSWERNAFHWNMCAWFTKFLISLPFKCND